MNISKVEKGSLGCYRVWKDTDTDFSFLVFGDFVFVGGSDCKNRPMATLETSRAVLVAMVDFLWEVHE